METLPDCTGSGNFIVSIGIISLSPDVVFLPGKQPGNIIIKSRQITNNLLFIIFLQPAAGRDEMKFYLYLVRLCIPFIKAAGHVLSDFPLAAGYPLFNIPISYHIKNQKAREIR